MLGGTVQLVYVAPQADSAITSTLGFLLSPKSAYVSGQVIRIGAIGDAKAADKVESVDWMKPLLGKDTCSGDSGGPFYVTDGKSGWLLAGATSRSTKSAMATCGDGGIYVRLDRYREWISDVAKVRIP